ncbi:methyltransferase, TIGR04325 family [Variovorax sp. OV329]|uniref:methyltransferase, TIGR04325 family n=1 Tax=Variovorax sp. OV329 TaxID=1882825 RepID=UPI0008EB93AE|nr:methyltransferase, TIGR04325 family [Variovorax sp. OV329]SFN38833.1 putative methyltransferase, LIC12133 family [Variovorax sp. OV329]
MAITRLRHLVRQVADSPLARSARINEHCKYFLSEAGAGSYHGLYSNFAQARAALPASNEFNQDSLADEYINIRSNQIFSYDYPILWWLRLALASGARRVLDLGGSVGVHYYAYARYMEMPEDLAWCVVEVPAMTRIGREEARRRGVSALEFVDDLAQAPDCDIVLSAGALQFFDYERPTELLEANGLRPRHVLLNKLPLYDGPDFVTAQNIGDGCYAPFHVHNRADFIADFEGTGFALQDQWAVHERSLILPGHPAHSFPSFSGMYLARA